MAKKYVVHRSGTYKVQNEVLIVKKAWRRKEEFRNRAWKLERLDAEVEEKVPALARATQRALRLYCLHFSLPCILWETR